MRWKNIFSGIPGVQVSLLLLPVILVYPVVSDSRCIMKWGPIGKVWLLHIGRKTCHCRLEFGECDKTWVHIYFKWCWRAAKRGIDISELPSYITRPYRCKQSYNTSRGVLHLEHGCRKIQCKHLFLPRPSSVSEWEIHVSLTIMNSLTHRHPRHAKRIQVMIWHGYLGTSAETAVNLD